MQARASTKMSELRAERGAGGGAVTPHTCNVLLELRTATGRWAGGPYCTPVHGVALMLVDISNFDVLVSMSM